MKEKIQTNLELFRNRLQKIFNSEDFLKLIETFSNDKLTIFRINYLLANSLEQVTQILLKEKINFKQINQDFFSVEAEFRKLLINSEVFKKSLIYIQNPSSMLAANMLDVTSNDIVLDLSAAPGSKTILLAEKMNNKGKIIANELVFERYNRLKLNCKQNGVENVEFLCSDGSFIWKKYSEYFDKILLDAPCSSESRIDFRDKESYFHWNERKIKEAQQRQLKLFQAALLALKVGGEMIYSTCSFAPEENEYVLTKMLKKFPDTFTILEIDVNIANKQIPLLEWQNKSFNPDVKRAVRILPTDIYDGFFIAKIKKQKSTKIDKIDHFHF